MAIKIQNTTIVDDNRNSTLLSLVVQQNAGGTGASFIKIPYYVDSTARDVAITVPTVGMVAFVGSLFQGYDGTKWDSIAGAALDEALVVAIMGL